MESKLKEARDELKAAEKAMSTGFLKWRPDYVEAEGSYQKAGRAFKIAGDITSAIMAWKKAAECSYKLGNLTQAALTLERAANEVTATKFDPDKKHATELLTLAADYFYEQNDLTRAADIYVRAARNFEGKDDARSAELLKKACNLFDDTPDKDVYAVEPHRRAMLACISSTDFDAAFTIMAKLTKIWTRLSQQHNIAKLALTKVILLLAELRSESARAAYNEHLAADGFCARAEAEACEELIIFFESMDAAGVNDFIQKKNVFGYLDPAVVRIARQLSKILESDTPLPVKTSAAKHYKGVQQQARTITTEDGKTMRIVNFGSGGAAKLTPEADAYDTTADKIARKAAAEDATNRSRLFGGDAVHVASYSAPTAAHSTPSAASSTSVPAPSALDDSFEFPDAADELAAEPASSKTHTNGFGGPVDVRMDGPVEDPAISFTTLPQPGEEETDDINEMIRGMDGVLGGLGGDSDDDENEGQSTIPSGKDILNSLAASTPDDVAEAPKVEEPRELHVATEDDLL